MLEQPKEVRDGLFLFPGEVTDRLEIIILKQSKFCIIWSLFKGFFSLRAYLQTLIAVLFMRSSPSQHVFFRLFSVIIHANKNGLIDWTK